MNKYTKLAKNSLLFAVGSFGSRAITFLMLPVYTRFLTPGEYGVIDVFITTILLLTPLLSVQAQEIAFRYSMDKDKSRSTTLINSLLFCFIGFMIVIIFLPIIIKIDFINEHAYLFFPVLLLYMLDGVLKQFVRGIGKIKQFVFADLLYSGIFVISNIIFIVKLKLGVDGYLLSLLISHIISIIFLLVAGESYKYVKILDCNISVAKSMIIYSFPLIPTAVMWWVMNVSDRYLLSYYLAFEANGIYAIASKIPIILATFNSVFFRAWQISAIEDYGSTDFHNMFSNVYQTLSVLLLLCTSVILIFLKPLFVVVAPNEFFAGWVYVPFLLLGVYFNALSGFWGVIYIASKKTIGALLSSGVGAFVNLTLNILLIPIIGIYGAAISTLISFLIMWIYRYIHINKTNKIQININRLVINILLVSIQICILYLVEEIILSSIFQGIMLLIIIIVNKEFVLMGYKKIIKKYKL